MHFLRLRTQYLTPVIAFIVAFLLALTFSFLPTGRYEAPREVTITQGQTLTAAGAALKEAGILRSRIAFRILAAVRGIDGVQAGTYTFSVPHSVNALLTRLAVGDTESEIRVTFPEGSTVQDMAQILGSKLPAFEQADFLLRARGKEGFLFPDTYFFLPSASSTDIISRMENNFAAHSDWQQHLGENESVESAVILASLLEAEAKTMEDKRIIAGILKKRLARDMPLQVDATFGYERGVRGYTPTGKDLEADSAYNTYRRRGLPPTPINNPGYESLLASVTPTEGPYLYYLTGTDGTMHYSETFDEHVAKKRLYLK